MPDQHAVLSPSGAERWLQCPASIRASKGVKRETSKWAEEGTTAHSLAELKFTYLLGRTTLEEYKAQHEAWAVGLDDAAVTEMHTHVDKYIELVQQRAADIPHSYILLEQRMPTGIPQCWGTSDAVIVSPSKVEIVDLKYGMGVKVSALDNPQLRLYALGALDTFGDVLGTTTSVTTTVCQPRLDWVSSEEMEADDLRAWRGSILPIAEEALGPNAHFSPSEQACRWCPVAGECRARMETMATIDFYNDPDLLEPGELADMVRRIKDVRAWTDAVEQTALRKAYSEGTSLPGLKVVMSGGRRYITDHEAAVEQLVSQGLRKSAVSTTKLKGFAELEKLLDAKLDDVIPTLVGRTDPKPALVPETDKRPAVNPEHEAAQEFGVG